MKNFITCLLCTLLFMMNKAWAQNMAINADGSTPDASAMVDISSTTKGLLVPRMTTAQQNSISLPAIGLLVFNTTDNVFKVNTGTAASPVWTPLSYSGTSIASLNGLTNTSQTFATGIAGTDFGINSSGSLHTFNIPTASAANRGALSAADWSTFNGKQGILSGTANRITITSNIIDISPAYTGQNSITTLGNIAIGVWNGTAVGATYGGTGQTSVTTGDLLYGSAANTYSKLTAGTNGQILTLTGGIPSWSANPGATAWNLTGNPVTAGSHFLGSTNNVSLRMRTNNVERMVIDSNGRVGIGTIAPASDFTISQSASSTAMGMRFTGNSIGGASSGTGFSMALGYNSSNNKQMWLGDADYLGNSAGTFFRFTAGNGVSIMDAVAGDNSARRSTALGVGGDPLSSIIFGYDNITTTPSSYVWDNGNMAIGNGYRANAAPSNGLLVQGNVGIGLTSPTAALHIGAGTATAGTAPLKFTSGTNLTTPEAGAVEFNGTHFYGTVGATRYQLDQQSTIFSGNFSGDVTGGQNTTVVGKINGVSLAGLGTGILKNTTGTGVPSIAVAADFPVLNQNTTGTAANVTGTVAVVNGGTGLTSATTGDLLYGSAANTYSKLAAGTNGQILTLTGGIPSWAANPGATAWSLTGNPVTAGSHFLGSTNNVSLRMRTNNVERMLVDSTGKVGIGITNPAALLEVKDQINIRNSGTVSQLLFTNTAGSGDFRVGGDGGDIFWQGGGTRALQMGSYWGTILAGDRQTAAFPSFTAGSANTGVLVQGQRDASVPLAIQANSATQSANLTEWRNASGTILNTVDKTGSVAIGASVFNGTNPEKLLVDAGTTTSVNAIVGKGSIDSYLQLNIQNNSAGTSASSDVVATANNGNETTNYVDMGINGGGNTNNIMGGANDGYLYTMGNNFLLGTGNAAKSLVFMTGGTSQAANERMRIDGTGNVGIGNTTPTQKLDITGNLKVSGAFMPNNNAGSLGYFLQSNGTGTAPSWIDASPYLTSLAWMQNGNSVSALKSFGTTSNYDLPFITNNTEKMRLTTTGRLGIGTTTPNYALHLHEATPNTSNWMQISNNASGSGTFDGFYYGVNAAGSPEIWAKNNLDIITGSGTTNNYSMRINPNGYVGIGTTTFNATNPEKLVVDAGTTTSVNAIVGKGSIDNYLQLNIQNNSAGTSASSDVVATANNGNETTNYVDMGINGGGNTNNIMGSANDGYLYTMGNNFLLGTGNAAKSLIFMTGGTSQTANERMRIDGTGNVGIGVTSPLYKLQVSAASNPLQLTGLQTGSNADSVLTISNGVVKRLSPSALITSSSNAWSLTGNAGTASTKLGTTNSFDLPIITNNTTKMTITSSGNVGIGSTSFDGSQPEKLLVDAGTSATNNLIGAYGDLNSYVQIGVQNRNSGNSASSDIVATADNGTNTTNYIDMGINSSSYTNSNSNLLNRQNVGYLYSNATADFFIGNGATNQDLVIFTNNGAAGSVTANGNEAVRIDANGNVGIGGTLRSGSGVATTNAEKLVVSGNIVPRTSGNGTVGTATYKWNAVYATNGTIQTSDRRMKTNIAKLKYGLKEVLAMRPVSFNWKTDPTTNNKVGLIAQEVKKIVPEVVTGDETKETLGLNYAELVPVLINAVKEQQKEIMELKKMILTLKNGK